MEKRLLVLLLVLCALALAFTPLPQLVLWGADETTWANRVNDLVIDLARHCPKSDSIFKAHDSFLWVNYKEQYGYYKQIER